MSIVTISRGTRSGGIALAQCLAERLGYPCLSREVLMTGARKYNIEVETLEAEITRTPGLWERLTGERHRYLVFVKCALLQAARDDNLIYHGHAGQVFLAGIGHVLKVRIEAPLEQRAEVAMRDLKQDRETATEFIRRSDEERRRWVRFLYDREWSDPSLYDLTLNLANMKLDTACDLVCDAIAHPEFKATEASLQKLQDLSLECEVMAGICADDRLWEQNIQVQVNRGHVTLLGRLKNREHRASLEAIVARVKGVGNYDLRVSLASDPPLEGPAWRD
jgi:cytidylate kinase